MTSTSALRRSKHPMRFQPRCCCAVALQACAQNKEQLQSCQAFLQLKEFKRQCYTEGSEAGDVCISHICVLSEVRFCHKQDSGSGIGRSAVLIPCGILCVFAGHKTV